MDFIIKLPKSKELITEIKYDLILIIIKRLIRYRIFVLYIKASFAKDLAYIVLRKVVANYKMLLE
jgi:hypothetical protein